MWQYAPGPPYGAPFVPRFAARGDFALDAAAAAAIAAVPVLPWTATESGYTRPEVVAGCVLTLGAIGLPYLSRTGIFGPGWTPGKLRNAKIVGAAPLAVCAATYFILDAVLGLLGSVAGGPTRFAPGPGAWVAAAAAVAVALPRRSDLIDGGPQVATRRWAAVLTVITAALPVCAVLGLLGVLLETFRSLPAVLELRALIALPAVRAALSGLWVIAVWRVARRGTRGEPSARLVLASAAAGALIWAVLAAAGQFALGTAESLYLPFGGYTLTMVAGLVIASPPLSPPVGGQPDAQSRLAAARGVLGLIIVADILLLAQAIAGVALTGALTPAVVTNVVGAGLGAIAADWARQRSAAGPAGGRTPVLIASMVQGVTGLATIVATGSSPNAWEAVTGPQVIAALALPVAAAAFMPAPAHPAHPAADPATPAAVLHALARQYPELWPDLAANPAAPSELLAWLAQSADPRVHAALRARSQWGRQP